MKFTVQIISGVFLVVLVLSTTTECFMQGLYQRIRRRNVSLEKKASSRNCSFLNKTPDKDWCQKRNKDHGQSDKIMSPSRYPKWLQQHRDHCQKKIEPSRFLEINQTNWFVNMGKAYCTQMILQVVNYTLWAAKDRVWILSRTSAVSWMTFCWVFFQFTADHKGVYHIR